MQRPRRGAHQDGTLLVIGGAESHDEGDDAILARFVELAGGPDARLVVIATASRHPEEMHRQYGDVFTRLGAGHVEALCLRQREQANDEHAVSVLQKATGVFFTGGDQMRITSVLGGSKVDSLLHARLAEGLVLAGTSAGAAMMSSTMIVSGHEAGVTTASVRTGPGMEFLPGLLIDMHFAERGRVNRLLSAVALYPHELGVGIDENTAILCAGGTLEVLGAGSVTIIDAGPAGTIRTPIDADGPITLCGVRLHVLPAGTRFDLIEREPRVEERDAY